MRSDAQRYILGGWVGGKVEGEWEGGWVREWVWVDGWVGGWAGGYVSGWVGGLREGVRGERWVGGCVWVPVGGSSIFVHPVGKSESWTDDWSRRGEGTNAERNKQQRKCLGDGSLSLRANVFGYFGFSKPSAERAR